MKWIRKGAAVLIAVLALSFVTFLAFQVLPGDPAMMRLGTNATPEALEALREEMGKRAKSDYESKYSYDCFWETMSSLYNSLFTQN